MNGGADAEILESFAKTTTNGASRTHRERKRSKLSDRKLCEFQSPRLLSSEEKTLLKLVAVDILFFSIFLFFFFLPTDPCMQSRDLERERESCDEVHRQIDIDFTRQI